MSQNLPLADGPNSLSAWAAAFAADQNAGPGTMIPLHRIFSVAAYPFAQPTPNPDHTSRFASAAPEQTGGNAKFANNGETGHA